MSNKIIESSNFTRCHQLNGHHRNTYIQSGFHSIACSEPENIESLDLIGRLEQLSNINEKQQSNNLSSINK
jgi:hypothetical protein